MRRSPELMSVDDTGLLVIDVQDKLVRLLPGHERLIWNIGRLIEGAKILGLPFAVTEQYPQGLGPTTRQLATHWEAVGTTTVVEEKVAFSCGGCEKAIAAATSGGRRNILVAGIETHVCVGQTVFDLLGEGYRVYVAVDAVGARHDIDHQTALRRMELAGANLTTTEAVLFEWCERAGSPQFKQISALVRTTPPVEDSSS